MILISGWTCSICFASPRQILLFLLTFKTSEVSEKRSLKLRKINVAQRGTMHCIGNVNISKQKKYAYIYSFEHTHNIYSCLFNYSTIYLYLYENGAVWNVHGFKDNALSFCGFSRKFGVCECNIPAKGVSIQKTFLVVQLTKLFWSDRLFGELCGHTKFFWVL